MKFQEIDDSDDSDKENEKTISEDELHSLLESEKRPVVLKFGASWCRPCLRTTPPFTDLITEKGGGGVVIVVVDRDDDEADALFARYDVQSLPTFVVFKNNTEKLRTQTVHELSHRIRDIMYDLPPGVADSTAISGDF